MFENDDQSFTSGRIEIETNERAVNHVIIFLDTYLPHFQRTFQNKTFETEVTHEDKISQMFYQSNTMHKYVSVHKRMYQNEVNQIELLHYWLPLS